jgi:hypothetical protein
VATEQSQGKRQNPEGSRAQWSRFNPKNGCAQKFNPKQSHREVEKGKYYLFEKDWKDFCNKKRW